MGCYFDGDGQYTEQYVALADVLVPAFGATGTLEGEILRAIGKLYYELYNNGMGNNVSGPYYFLKSLQLHGVNEAIEPFEPYVSGSIPAQSEFPKLYESAEAMVDRVMECVIRMTADNAPPTEFSGDMFDWEVPAVNHRDAFFYSDEEYDNSFFR